MKTTLFKNLIFLLMIGFLLGACKKEKGPQGETGLKGETGSKGDKGDQGDKGSTGTANVIFSDWIAIPSTATVSLANRKNFGINAPGITQEVYERGIIYTYLKQDGYDRIFPLPYSVRVISNGEIVGSYLTSVLVGVGSLSLNQDWLTPGPIHPSFANSTSVLGSYTHIRYVIIPGGVHVNSSSVNFNDYESVKAHFKLRE